MNVEYIERLKTFTSEIIIFSYRWWRKGVKPDKSTIDTFSDIIIQNNVNAVHANTIMLREPLIAAKNNGIPAIVHVRELIKYDRYLCDYIGLTSGQIIEEIFANSDFIIANSNATFKCFNIVGRTFVIPNCIDTNIFNIKNIIDPSKINIALISSNIPKKGIDDFFLISALMEKDTPNAKFLLIGPQNKYTEEYKRRQQNGEFKNVVFCGYKMNPLLAIKEANIVLNLSHFQESFGRTVLEAMAARRPVVAYSWGALPELVKDGENGFLVPYKDINSIIKRLKKLCNNVGLIKKMGYKGRRYAQNGFSKKSYLIYVKSTYDKVFGSMSICVAQVK